MGKNTTTVSLILDNERIPVKVGDSTFFIRRLKSTERESILDQCTVKGITNFTRAARKYVEAAMLGWDNVCSDGKPIEYDPKLIDSLPDGVFLLISNRMNVFNPEAEDNRDFEKN